MKKWLMNDKNFVKVTVAMMFLYPFFAFMGNTNSVPVSKTNQLQITLSKTNDNYKLEVNVSTNAADKFFQNVVVPSVITVVW